VRDLIFCLILYMVNYGRVGKCIMRKSKRYPAILDEAKNCPIASGNKAAKMWSAIFIFLFFALCDDYTLLLL
jgi:hypothetical protein